MEAKVTIKAYVQEFSYIALFSSDPGRPQPTLYRAVIEEVTTRINKFGEECCPRRKGIARGPERRKEAEAERDLKKLKAKHGIA